MVIDHVQTWEIWYPGAAATGLPIARARIDPADVVWVHSVPRKLAVTVRQGDDHVIARGEPLERDGGYLPMTRLTIEGDRITREAGRRKRTSAPSWSCPAARPAS
jgi:hypothetical protein